VIVIAANTNQDGVQNAKVHRFHADMALEPAQVALLRQKTLAGTVDQYGARRLEPICSREGKGICYLLEVLGEDAVRDQHNGTEPVVTIESLVHPRNANEVLR
jgi:hypothetical protein